MKKFLIPLQIIAAAPLQAGEIALPDNVTIKIEGDKRIIESDGIPTYNPGTFPRRGNPNPISRQEYRFEVPADPQKSDGHSIPAIGMPFGVTLDGLPMDPGAAEFWQGDRHWQYEPMQGTINLGLDDNNAHVQPNGAYHYHAIPKGLLEHRSKGKIAMTQLGWAADGFPIYGPWVYKDADDPGSGVKKAGASYRVKKGKRQDGPAGNYDGSFVADYEYVKDSGDLDEHNGREGVTPEFPDATYYYVLTEDFPYIPRSYRGEPDSTFKNRGYMKGGRPPGPPHGGPPRGRPPDPEGGPPRGRPPRGERDPLDFLDLLDEIE